MPYGSLFLANNIQELNYIIGSRACKPTKCKVVVVDDEIINQEDYIGGSILLPPPSVIYNLIDNNDRYQFRQMYSLYLQSEPVMQYLAVLILALFKGTDIILYTHNSDESMFIQELTYYMCSLGLVFTTPYYIYVPAIRAVDNLSNIVQQFGNAAIIPQQYDDGEMFGGGYRD